MQNTFYYLTRTLWTGSGVLAMAAGSIDTSEETLLKLLMFLTGIVTLLLSLLLGGFIKHLTGHQQDRAALFTSIEKKMDRISNKISAFQTKENCEMFHLAQERLFKLQVREVEARIKNAAKP